MNAVDIDVLRIRTPDGVEFTLPLAGPMSRMYAWMLDMLVIAAASIALNRVFQPFNMIIPDIAGALNAVLYFVVTLTYSMLTEWIWRGQTIGKRLLKLRVVDAQGLKLEPAQIIVRNLMRFVDFLPLLYLVGGIACLSTRHQQRLGDLAAGTLVIRTRNLAPPNLDELLGSKYNSLAAYRHLTARLRQKVTPEMAAIALEALVRRDQLDPSARLTLFHDLAQAFRVLVPIPPEAVEQLTDEQYIRDVVEVLYRPRMRETAGAPQR